jgi:3-oxoacyl-[acyl-carrier-protein] synthase-3
MRIHNVTIESMAVALPAEVVTSAALEQQLAAVYERFNLHVGRLELMTGIRERRQWPRGAPPSAGSSFAGLKALEQANLASSSIDYLLHTSVSRDFLEPATASVVHHALGLPDHAPFFDISNACLGFVNGMLTMASMIELGQVQRGLVVAGESSRMLVETTISDLLSRDNLTRRDLKNAFASLTIGSGAMAMVLSHTDVARGGHRLCGATVQSDTRHNDLCRGSSDTGFAHDTAVLMDTASEELLEAGCALAARTWPLFCEEMGWSAVDRCSTHQVGVAHRERLYDVLKRDPSMDYTTLEFMGNVGSVSLPATFALSLEQNPPRDGERVALLGIGSGLSCGMVGVETCAT